MYVIRWAWYLLFNNVGQLQVLVLIIMKRNSKLSADLKSSIHLDVNRSINP